MQSDNSQTLLTVGLLFEYTPAYACFLLVLLLLFVSVFCRVDVMGHVLTVGDPIGTYIPT
jgi:hypothetical protein